MSKSASRPSLASRLAAVAGPQIQPVPTPRPETTVAVKVQAPKMKADAQLTEAAPAPVSTISPARVGKTMIAGYFSPQMAKAVKLLAVERDATVQALIGEGLDAILHKYGKHPMGER